MPHLKELVDELVEDPIVFVSITDEDEQQIEKFLSKRKMPGWVGVDSDGSVFESYGITGRPKTVVVDPAGNVAMVTASHLLTAEDLRSVASGEYEPDSNPAKKETSRSSLPQLGSFSPGYDPYMMPWVLSGEAQAGPGHQTTLRPSCCDTPAGSGNSFNQGAVGISAVGQSATDLIVLAHSLTSKYRITDEAGLSPELFDLVYSRPKDSSLAKAWEEIRELIEEYFQIKVTPFNETRNVWVVTLDKGKLASAEDQNWDNDPSVKTLKSVSMFLQLYESSTGNLVVIDADPTKWFIDVFTEKWYEHKGEELRIWLQSKGLNFKKMDREVKLWRVEKIRRQDK